MVSTCKDCWSYLPCEMVANRSLQPELVRELQSLLIAGSSTDCLVIVMIRVDRMQKKYSSHPVYN
jgi:hypothetical protein